MCVQLDDPLRYAPVDLGGQQTQEAAALASLALFVGMIAIWSQVFSNL